MPTPRLRLTVERSLLRTGHSVLVCLDEVGRGALAGPVAVGAVAVAQQTPPCPRGVRDSKLLSDQGRRKLVPEIQAWAHAWSVGKAEAQEVDALGVTAALGLAAHRALGSVGSFDAVLLDGPFDYVTPAASSMPKAFTVYTRVRADLTCAGVAAASILAKVTRDDVMKELDRSHPGYAFDRHKGYGSPAHRSALATLGPSPAHRMSFRLTAD